MLGLESENPDFLLTKAIPLIRQTLETGRAAIVYIPVGRQWVAHFELL